MASPTLSSPKSPAVDTPTSPSFLRVPLGPIVIRKEPEYYARVDSGLASRIKDFDNPVQFKVLLDAARSSSTKNFLLDYGSKEAWFAADIPESSLVNLAKEPELLGSSSRWIQIWYPHLQSEAIEALSKRYNFSPRLTALMRDKPSDRSPAANPEPDSQTKHIQSPIAQNASKTSFDTEKAYVTVSSQPSMDSGELLRSLGHYDIVNSIWHWSSIDVGPKYVCLGYNALHQVVPGSSENAYDRPSGTRIWNWLILCDDDTVISIVESPPEPPLRSEKMSGIRRNLLNVLEQLSTCVQDLQSRNPISIVPIRHLFVEENIDSADAAGLLFYYLFDDWYSTYPLLAKGGHQYGAALNRVRKSMRRHADLKHVDELYCLGRQLALLKRVYQSYELLIDKILEKYSKMLDTEPGFRQSTKTGDELTLSRIDTPQRDKSEVYLGPEVLVRFERLRDRIRLYVISEIQESIDIKDSLLSMNFNLITIKESDAVERLTRITILLGKATILFLPVSLMTAYFSIKITGVEYTLAQFWVSFAVLLVISFLMLLAFGKISGTTEGDMIYKPFNKIVAEFAKFFFGRLCGSRQ